MTRNRFTEVPRGPSWWPSQDAREERANPTLVSGVSAVSALVGLIRTSRRKAGRRNHAARAETRETGETMQQPSGQQQKQFSNVELCDETPVGDLRSPLRSTPT